MPEGYNLYDIADVVEQAGLGPAPTSSPWRRVIWSLVRDLDPQAQSLEGYLFPDTYEFTRIDTTHDIAAAMVQRFRQAAQKIGLAGRPDIHRMVTWRRSWRRKPPCPRSVRWWPACTSTGWTGTWLLGADPTVIYAALLAGRYRGTIYQSDLQFDSPYNTYKYPGLPPGPIANPGVASLEAAMHPAHSDFLYFVSDNNGHHRFSRSLEEHAKNVTAYRKAVAAPR